MTDDRSLVTEDMAVRAQEAAYQFACRTQRGATRPSTGSIRAGLEAVASDIAQAARRDERAKCAERALAILDNISTTAGETISELRKQAGLWWVSP